MQRRAALALLAAVSCYSCGPSPSPPPAPAPDPPPGAQRITGSERLGWDQADEGADPAWLRFAIYVDGVRTALPDAACGLTVTAGNYQCSARLPALTLGIHSLELTASYFGVEQLESSRSLPLVVQVVGPVGATAGLASIDPGSARPAPGMVTTRDGARLTLEVVAEGLEDPTDLAFGPERRIFVSERAGGIRVVRDGALEPPAAATVDTAPSGGLLSLAVDPQFSRTGFVYALAVVPREPDGLTFRLVRLQERNGGLANAITLLEDVPATSHSKGTLRFGPDGKLYVGLDHADDASLPGDLASYNGKVLRLNTDGSTPDDQPAFSPVHSWPHASPVGLAWRTPGALWVLDAPGAETGYLVGTTLDGTRPSRARAITRLALPPRTAASSMTFYGGEAIPEFRGDLLIASGEGAYILRLRIDAQNPWRVTETERLSVGTGGAVRAVASDPEGMVYFCIGRTLARLRPLAGL